HGMRACEPLLCGRLQALAFAQVDGDAVDAQEGGDTLERDRERVRQGELRGGATEDAQERPASIELDVQRTRALRRADRPPRLRAPARRPRSAGPPMPSFRPPGDKDRRLRPPAGP